MDGGISVKRSRRTPVYNIGTVSRLCGLPVHRLRWVERAGLVSPGRSEGKHRLFSEEDVAVLSEIRALLRQRVNVSGIRIILRMRGERRRVPR